MHINCLLTKREGRRGPYCHDRGPIYPSTACASSVSKLVGTMGEVSPRKSVVQSACQYDVTSRVSVFQNCYVANKVFIEETDKNFDFITEILFRFLGFGDFKVSIVVEN